MSEAKSFPVSPVAMQTFVSASFARDHLVTVRGKHVFLVLDPVRKEWTLRAEPTVLPVHALDLETFGAVHKAAVASVPMRLLPSKVGGKHVALLSAPAEHEPESVEAR
jgi:hypothetical protein